MNWIQLLQIIATLFSVTGTILASIVALRSVNLYKAQKAYDLFTARRLQNYEFLLGVYQELMAISTVDYIDMAVAESREKYLGNYEVTLAKLNGALSTTEKLDGYLLSEYNRLHDAVKEYVASKSAAAAQALNQQREHVKYFTDVFLWALWRYYQHLHEKKKNTNLHNDYDQQFEKVYQRSMGLNKEKTTFFKDYPIDLLVDHLSDETTGKK